VRHLAVTEIAPKKAGVAPGFFLCEIQFRVMFRPFSPLASLRLGGNLFAGGNQSRITFKPFSLLTNCSLGIMPSWRKISRPEALTMISVGTRDTW